MQRPIMNPMFLDEVDAAPPRPSFRARLFGLVRFVGSLLLTDMRFWQPASRLQIEDGSPVSRIASSLLYRLLFVPAALVVVIAVLVWIGTHPPASAAVADPLTMGVHYDPVSFVASDGARLEGWFVPMLDPDLVLDKKDRFLRTKFPAVVLAHDFGSTRHQMLPLVQPLHEAGYVALVVGLRGSNGPASKGSAFGLREHADILAAVELLRRRPGVDPDRIAVLGIGTGANAAYLAAEQDQKIAALILDHPITNIDRLIDEQIAPPQPWLQWLRPICKWTFELAYRVDVEDLETLNAEVSASRCPILLFDSSPGSAQSFRHAGRRGIRDFLAQHLPRPRETATANVEVRELK